MQEQIDDIMLTAYALGELSGAERAAVAAHLAGSAPARRFVADVRSTASLLSDELSRESFGGMTDLQHEVIEDKLRESMKISHHLALRPRSSRVARWNRAVFAMSLAASVMIVCGVVSVLIPIISRHNQQPTIVKKGGDEKSSTTDSGSSSKSTPDINIADDEFDPALNIRHFPRPDFNIVEGDSRNVADDDSSDPIIGVAPPIAPRAPQDKPQIADAHPVTPEINPTPQAPSPVNPPKVTPSSVDKNAFVPRGSQAPGKTPEHVESSPNGKLPSGDQYAHLLENPYISPKDDPYSQFSAGVDTASYSNIRRFLTHGTLPPKDAVRIEEMLNYFPVKVPAQNGDGPLSLQVELGACPWRPQIRLARVCLAAREMSTAARPPVNLVFLIDTSESMRREKTKLPLLKSAIRQLVGQLSVSDRVTLIGYNVEPQVVLPPTAADAKQQINDALDKLEHANAPTGGQGIELAYDMAAKSFLRNGVNRVILATDGNWNVGVTDRKAVEAIAAQRAESNISLTVLGVGMENLKDDTLQKLSAAGNGSYAYIDTLAEARKVLDDQINGALVIVARDVKVQVKFDPATVDSYRLIGYERRSLSKEEMKSQSHPGGDLGAGQSVTALYEVIPLTTAGKGAELLTATAVYHAPALSTQQSLTHNGIDNATPLPKTSPEFRFAAAVAEFGLVLRNSDHKHGATFASVLDHAKESNFGPDEAGYRREFLKLVERAKTLDPHSGL